MAKSKKQQAAIAISMKAAGKTPKMKMQMGGGYVGKKSKSAYNAQDISAISQGKPTSAMTSFASRPPVYKKGGSVGGKKPMTASQKKFASLAPPKNKITFADKIAGSKKKKK